MKSLSTILGLGLIFAVGPAAQAENNPTERQKKLREIDKLETELKPLRIRATRETEVIAARKEADDALRRYYEVLRKKMSQLEPKSKKKLERQVLLRREVYSGSAGSRAEDYMVSAAKEKSTKVTKNNP